MKTKWTPGPWRRHKDNRSQIVAGADSQNVINLRGAMGGDNVLADERLIIAAPEMVSLLIEAQARIFALQGHSNLTDRIDALLDHIEGN